MLILMLNNNHSLYIFNRVSKACSVIAFVFSLKSLNSYTLCMYINSHKNPKWFYLENIKIRIEPRLVKHCITILCQSGLPKLSHIMLYNVTLSVTCRNPVVFIGCHSFLHQ
jgi:hypothetical protein